MIKVFNILLDLFWNGIKTISGAFAFILLVFIVIGPLFGIGFLIDYSRWYFILYIFYFGILYKFTE